VVHGGFKLITGDKKAPIGMRWSFTIKNTGCSPARVVVKKNVPQFTTGDHVATIPYLGPSQGSILMMPNQTANLTGHLRDADGYAKAADILTGTTVLTVDIELSYTAIGWLWWNNAFIYQARNRFRHDYSPQAFIMESAFAD